MKEFLIILCTVLLFGTDLYSQEKTDKPPRNYTKFLHFEAGYINPVGKIKESVAIRQNISSYYVNQSSNGNISSATSGILLGMRLEYFVTRFRAGLSTGLRYSGYISEISGFSSSSADFFYLRYSMLNSDTKFARVKSIHEVNNLISIPIEIRYVTADYQGVGLFAKAGIEFSPININKNTHINFQQKSMESQENLILENIGTNTNKFYSTFYSSVGLKLGHKNKPNCMFEVFLPSIFLTKNNFTLSDVDYYFGIKCSIQFPLK